LKHDEKKEFLKTHFLITFKRFITFIFHLFVYLPDNVKTKELNMLFAEKIKQLREERQLPQRQLAAELQIDTATYCKIERGDRRAKREQVVKLAEWFHTDTKELLTLWLADKVIEAMKDERELANEALGIVQKHIEK
jgi:transcriptional regulator with XRE-family HTH domain